MNIQSTFQLDTEQLTAISNRQSIFLDANIWIPLRDAQTFEAIECRSLLEEVVASGLAFCPLSFTAILELLLQEYESARREAELMERLSLNIVLRIKSEIFDEEVLELLRKFRDSPSDITTIQLDKARIFAPLSAFVGSGLRLKYPPDTPSEFATRATPLLQQSLSEMGVVGLVDLFKSALPMNSWRDRVDPLEYTRVWEERFQAVRGNRQAARQIELQGVLQSEWAPRLESLPKLFPPLSMTPALISMQRYCNSQGRRSGEVLMRKLPAINRLIDIATVTGLNYNRQATLNDSVDIENMIVPPVYTDVFVARDRWVRQILNDDEIRTSNQTECIFSLPDLANYCRRLLTNY